MGMATAQKGRNSPAVQAAAHSARQQQQQYRQQDTNVRWGAANINGEHACTPPLTPLSGSCTSIYHENRMCMPTAGQLLLLLLLFATAWLPTRQAICTFAR